MKRRAKVKALMSFYGYTKKEAEEVLEDIGG